jgi:hypothetical protein
LESHRSAWCNTDHVKKMLTVNGKNWLLGMARAILVDASKIARQTIVRSLVAPQGNLSQISMASADLTWAAHSLASLIQTLAVAKYLNFRQAANARGVRLTQRAAGISSSL